MTPEELTKIITGIGQYGVLGWVAYLLGKRFLLTSDEDRKWIKDFGQQQMTEMVENRATNKAIMQANQVLLETNKALIETLRLLTEKSK